MKKYFGVLFYVFAAWIPFFAFAAQPVGQIQPLNTQIDTLLLGVGENLNVGLIVENLNTGTVIYQKNADRYFMPASNGKLFTAFAALQYLGPYFTYQTRLFADVSKIQNGVLNDNIYVQFSGDPTLTMAQLDHLISALAKAGIQRINGSIIVDDTAFDKSVMSPGTSWDDKKYCFGAPVSALMIEHNCVAAFLKPADKPGQPAYLFLPNQPQFVHFQSTAFTGMPNADDCKPTIEATDESTYTIRGCVKAKDTIKEFVVPIHNPRLYTQAALIYLLNKNLITNTHDVKFQKITTPPNVLASNASPPLQVLINTMLKESDNLIANALFKTMGLVYTQKPGSWKNGSAALQDIFVKAISSDFAKLSLKDGAGASRYNFVTPKQIISLLRKAYSQSYRNVFMAALPISGLDGTLKWRMNTPEMTGKIYAKTGTMTAVTALSGFLVTKNQQTLIFAMIINGFVDSESKYKILEDKVCQILVNAV